MTGAGATDPLLNYNTSLNIYQISRSEDGSSACASIFLIPALCVSACSHARVCGLQGCDHMTENKTHRKAIRQAACGAH